MRLTTMAFVAGFTVAVGLEMALQDWYGLEGWIAHLREEWVPLSPAWGLMVAFVAIIGFAAIVAREAR